jgi:hypothetical protein
MKRWQLWMAAALLGGCCGAREAPAPATPAPTAPAAAPAPVEAPRGQRWRLEPSQSEAWLGIAGSELDAPAALAVSEGALVEGPRGVEALWWSGPAAAKPGADPRIEALLRAPAGFGGGALRFEAARVTRASSGGASHQAEGRLVARGEPWPLVVSADLRREEGRVRVEARALFNPRRIGAEGEEIDPALLERGLRARWVLVFVPEP